MANGHRSQIKRERNSRKDTRPSAKLSYARIPVQKACFVMDAIRGKDVAEAEAILLYNPRYASSVILKLLKSAVANAENNLGMNADNLYIAECRADNGPIMKRIQPRAQGRAYRILKRECHLTIILDEKNASAKAQDTKDEKAADAASDKETSAKADAKTEEAPAEKTEAKD
jgi:large subunit ribosomal protein L22